MKERLFTGWTIQRGLFLVLGAVILIQSIMDKQWFGIVFGIYFASMGLFAIGCAACNCYTGTNYYKHNQNTITKSDDIDFDESKTK